MGVMCMYRPYRQYYGELTGKINLTLEVDPQYTMVYVIDYDRTYGTVLCYYTAVKEGFLPIYGSGEITVKGECRGKTVSQTYELELEGKDHLVTLIFSFPGKIELGEYPCSIMAEAIYTGIIPKFQATGSATASTTLVFKGDETYSDDYMEQLDYELEESGAPPEEVDIARRTIRRIMRVRRR